MPEGYFVTLFINGKCYKLAEAEVDPRWNLLQFLRKERLTGTKLGCGEGGCGACTVMISSYDEEKQAIRHYSTNACLTPLCALDGCAVTTVEGIGGMKQGLHPVQKRLSSMHGSQCGFCTPGIVMAIYTQLRSKPNSTPHELEESLDGNLCRCTGYRPIIDAARSLSNNKPPESGCCGGSPDGCPCKTSEETKTVVNNSEKAISCESGLNSKNLEGTYTEPIFPPSLMRYKFEYLKISNCDVKWFQPLTLEQLLDLKSEYPQGKLVVGNTEIGIEVKFKAFEYNVLINPTRVSELQVLETVVEDGVEGLKVGSAVTINRLRDYALTFKESALKSGKAYQARGLMAIRHMLTWFASNHIRNVACVGGNIATASPISDLNPMLMSCKAILLITSKKSGTRKLPISEFFLSYRKVDLQEGEILEAVFIPLTTQFEFVLPFKQARRREDDISIVSSGMRFSLAPSDDNTLWEIKDCVLAFGGMAPFTTRAVKTASCLIGKTWNSTTFEESYPVLRNELSLPETVPGGQSEYRMSLTLSFLFKAFLTITSELKNYLSSSDGPNNFPPSPALDPSDSSGLHNFVTKEKDYSRGEQRYNKRDGGMQAALPAPHTPLPEDTGRGIVGKPLMHKNAEAQVSGETKYTDDMPMPADGVYGCLVLSTRAHAKILSVDTSDAEKCSGYVAYFSAKDVVGSNHIGAVIKDEEVFAEEIVKYYGAVIGIIVAKSHEEAVYAVRKVKVEYEDISPVIVSIADAIEHNSFYPGEHTIESGDLEAEQANAEIIVEGECRMGAQDHFYLETNCTKVFPTESDHLEIFSSTQNCAKTQNFCASVCGIPASKVVAKCKRMGGGFGGKETRSVFIACTAALAAHLLKRPVSINIERDVDMSICGQRHAFFATYRAGCNKDGTLKFLDTKLYNNVGFSLDLSQPVMDRALFHVDNVYHWPALRARGKLCRTNQPSHTAFRGFGGPQGMIITEMVMQHLAAKVGIEPETLKTKNLYKEGAITPFGQRLEAFFIPRLWNEVHNVAEVARRSEEVNKFNKENRWKKRGIAVVPTKFGISFTAKFMNQAGALVHVYTDGSVLVSHGGTEMGQGLYTKIIQIAAQCLGVPDSLVITAETATNCVANASPTAASASTDLYGMAVLDACEQILARLKPVRESLPPDAEWKTVVTKAYFDRINLSAQGFYIVDGDRCGFDWDKVLKPGEPISAKGTPFNYFTQGVACCEVEIDCLTGDSQVLRADVVMDVGKSINPALDIGQIEGAFVQGFGWSTMEEMVWGDKEHPWVRPGQLFTRGPGTYKIPSFNDVPLDFRVHLSDTDNRFAVHSSKAIGEPPFFLGSSAFFAIQKAVAAARAERGVEGYYPMDLPASSERIRMGCSDKFSSLCVSSVDGSQEAKSGTGFKPKGSF